MCMCTIVSSGARRGQKRVLDVQSVGSVLQPHSRLTLVIKSSKVKMGGSL